METTEHHPNDMPLNTMFKSQKDDIQRVFYAGFGPRFVAYLIDLIVIWGVNSIVTRPILRLLNLEGAKLWINMFSAANITTSIIFFLYFILMTKFFRATLGKMILGLSVESLHTHSLTNGQIIFRECIGRYISMALLGLPYLVVAFTKRHQGIHDLFADTSVIKNKFKHLNDSIERDVE
ncbi:RDD family protein [Halobacillus naozhouensis]|uniref:RDD family protein n=1 Tax=Halobacillus naozhouensis TaxID=554880 RepID=A0ABY8J237_9BACI|nr:RDD family protein [Halobacillus naozhouensis]WFT75474.1 RDD family protein [Halobacillus naozhouensis]